MLTQLPTNLCFRCGKQRITTRTYKERVGGSTITSSDTSCPDPKCQALLDMQFEKERIQREHFAVMHQQRPFAGGRKKKEDTR